MAQLESGDRVRVKAGGNWALPAGATGTVNLRSPLYPGIVRITWDDPAVGSNTAGWDEDRFEKIGKQRTDFYADLNAALDQASTALAARSGEVRTVDPTTGAEKGRKLARFDLIPPRPLWQVAELYGRGAKKYADRNWEKGYAWSLSYAAAQRHLSQFWAREDTDTELGMPHLAAAVFHILALMEFTRTHPEKDDRP
jgi:dATP/dGTP diphosphohydrolase, N-terminal